MKTFPYDVILEPPDICNLRVQAEQIERLVLQGKRVLVFGRRNTGKTSVVEGLVVPAFRRRRKNAFVLLTDFMGVHSMDDITTRFARAFESGFRDSFPARSTFNKMVELIKGARPAVSVDERGTWTIALGGWQSHEPPPDLGRLFAQIRSLEKASVPVLLVLDEFQDIHFVDGAEGVLRNELQRLKKDTAVIVLGSKRHILSQMFAAHDSPFYSWGEPVEMDAIPYEEYHAYMKERFRARRLKLSREIAEQIQDLMDRNPEPVNILCAYLLDTAPAGATLTSERVEDALHQLVGARRSKMEEYLTRFTEGEAEVLVGFAKLGPISQPSGKDFVGRFKLSKAGVSKIVSKLLDEAVLYRENDAYVLADPLLKHHLRRYR